MNNMFINKMCYYCVNNNCNKMVLIEKSGNCVVYRCNEYIKDKNKIVPYQEPLVVTVERDYMNRKQI